MTDHLPMASESDRLTRFWRNAKSFGLLESIAADAEAAAVRMAEDARGARQRADEARAEMQRSYDALALTEVDQVRAQLEMT